jgi:YD repeat-containing protein
MTKTKFFCGKAVSVWIFFFLFAFLCAVAQGQSSSGTTVTLQSSIHTRASSSTWAHMKAVGSARQFHAGSSKVERTYDAQGRLTKILEPDQDGNLTIETEYTRNAQGTLTQIVQHGQKGDTPRIRTFTYDKLNRLISSSSPESGVTTYTYRQDGKIVTKTDARGIITSYTWDQKGNLVGKQYSNGDPSVVYVYDDKTGKLSASYLDTSSGPRAKRTYFYNDQGTLDHLIQQGKNNYHVSLTYDTSGHTNEIHYPDGRVVLLLRDDKGKLSSITDEDGTVYLSKAQFSASNALQSAQLGNNLTVETIFNRQGNLRNLRVLRWGDQFVLDKHFSYTKDGSIARLKDALNPASTLAYSYDNLLRVSGYAEPKRELKHGYNYDAFGNIDLKDDLPFAQTYDASNRIGADSGLTYDQAGEMTFDGSHQYQYDAEGRISQVDNGAIRYVYSAEGDRLQKRIGKAVTEEVRLGNDLLAERAANGTWTDYLYAAGRRIAAIRGTGVTYYVADPLGTTRTEFSASGEVIAQSDVSPFGQTIHSSAAQAIPFTNGEQYDPETGLNS